MWLAAIRLSSLTVSETKSQSPLKSPWPSDAAHFHKNFLAVHGSML